MLCTFRPYVRTFQLSVPSAPIIRNVPLFYSLYIIPYILYIVHSVCTERLVFRQQATDDEITRALVLYTILFAAAMVWGEWLCALCSCCAEPTTSTTSPRVYVLRIHTEPKYTQCIFPEQHSKEQHSIIYISTCLLIFNRTVLFHSLLRNASFCHFVNV